MAVKAFQIDKSLSVTGIVDTVTATTIMAALNTKAKESDSVKDLEGQINALTAKIEAARRDLSL